jgi:LytS/YehU family sensor histidine kinase
MLLQPLIENALKYSRQCSDLPQVRMEAAVSGRHLLVKITNSGLFDKQLSDGNGNGNGIGMANIRNRLELHYGSSAKFHFQISSRQATAEVQLPLRQSA